MKIQCHSKIVPILIFLFPLLNGSAPSAWCGILLFEGFETDGLGLRYDATTAFSDGADDYFIRTDGFTEASGVPAYTDFSGDYFWAAEDVDSVVNPTGLGILDFTGIDLAGFESIRISFDIGAGATDVFDRTDDFVLVQFRIDAGAWTTAMAFQNDGTTFNSGMHQDLDLDGIGEGPMLGLSLQTFASQDFEVSGNLMDLRLDTFVNSGSEAIAFDNLQVVGIPEPRTYALTFSLIMGLMIIRKRFLPGWENESRA